MAPTHDNNAATDETVETRRDQARVGVRMSAANRHSLKVALTEQSTSVQEYLEACAVAYVMATPAQQEAIAAAIRNTDASADGAQAAGAQLYDLITGASTYSFGGLTENYDTGAHR